MKNYGAKKLLPTDRTLFYTAFCPRALANELNTIASDYDGEHTKLSIFSSIFGFARCAKRINNELERRGLDYRISSWFTSSGKMLLMCLLFFPNFVYPHQIATAMNILSEDYNAKG